MTNNDSDDKLFISIWLEEKDVQKVKELRAWVYVEGVSRALQLWWNRLWLGVFTVIGMLALLTAHSRNGRFSSVPSADRGRERSETVEPISIFLFLRLCELFFLVF